MRGLTVEALNPSILNVQYAVRGELAIKAEEYRVRLKGGATDLPFNKVISSNIGNPQQMGLDQPPITFNRQVGAGTANRFWRSDRALTLSLRRYLGGGCCFVGLIRWRWATDRWRR